jgi:hypothetical protein
MPFDLLIDQTTNDLALVNGDLIFTQSNPVEVGQRVAMKLRTFEGEWFLDTDYGIPFLDQIINARTKKEVDAIYIGEIRDEDGVESIISYSSNLDKNTRSYEANVTISTADGIIEIPIYDSPATQWQYPIPLVTDPSADCGFNAGVDSVDQLINLTNRLFQFININGLPESGNSTWINTWA